MHTNVTYDQIKQFEVNPALEEALKDSVKRESFSLFETSDKKFYLYNLLDNRLYYITEDYYKYLISINCFSNFCTDEEHVLNIIKNSQQNWITITEKGDMK